MSALTYLCLMILTAVCLWSSCLAISTVRILIWIKKIRGTFRRDDFAQLAIYGALAGGSALVLFNTARGLHDMVSPLIAFGTVALILLSYFTERHIKNVQDIRKLKQLDL